MSTPLAQDPNESFDVVTCDGQPTGRVKPRAAVHRDGDWHRSIHVWVAGVDEAGPFLTFQRRSRAKDTWGGKLDATVGGHFRAGESLVETLREVQEEIGVDVDLANLIDLGVRVCVSDAESGVRDRELQRVFLWLDNRPLMDFAPDPVELASLVRFGLTDLLTFFAGEASELTGTARRPGSTDLHPTLARRDDFIPQVDRYYYRIAILAGRALRSERHLAI